MNPGLLHDRKKNTRTFVFYFEGGAMRFAEFLERWGIRYTWRIDLDAGTNEITIS
jgi:hypothetical protein